MQVMARVRDVMAFLTGGIWRIHSPPILILYIYEHNILIFRERQFYRIRDLLLHYDYHVTGGHSVMIEGVDLPHKPL